MGNTSGKHAENSGILHSVLSPPLDGVQLPKPLDKKKTLRFRVPKGKKGGDTICIMNGPTPLRVDIPKGINSEELCTCNVQKTKEELCKQVYASTMQMIPGMVVVSAKPIIYGNVIQSYYLGGSSISNLNSLTKEIGALMEQANAKILEQAIDCGCNAVLGMTFQLTNNTMGETGPQLLIVTACGTPCIVVKSGALPTVATGALIVNDQLSSTADIVAATVMVEPYYVDPY